MQRPRSLSALVALGAAQSATAVQQGRFELDPHGRPQRGSSSASVMPDGPPPTARWEAMRPLRSLGAFYEAQLLPRFVDKACGVKAINDLHAGVADGLHGDVVEIGFGSGLTCPTCRLPSAASSPSTRRLPGDGSPPADSRSVPSPWSSSAPTVKTFPWTTGRGTPCSARSRCAPSPTWGVPSASSTVCCAPVDSSTSSNTASHPYRPSPNGNTGSHHFNGGSAADATSTGRSTAFSPRRVRDQHAALSLPQRTEDPQLPLQGVARKA